MNGTTKLSYVSIKKEKVPKQCIQKKTFKKIIPTTRFQQVGF